MAKKAPEPLGGALKKLQALYAFMTEHDLGELEIENTDERVRLARRTRYQPAAAAVEAPAAAGPAASTPEPAAVPPGAATITAPMMGIFYRAASPSSPPFVKEGDQVNEGQVLCMIEAMKVFNEIKADFPCTVLKVLVENGKPVKAGQPMFVARR